MRLAYGIGVCVAASCACSARPGGELAGDEARAGASAAGNASSTSNGGSAAVGSSGPSGPSAGMPSGPPQPPRELMEVDSGYPLETPVLGVCPAGTAPSERFVCTDVPYCRCEYVCSPACGAGEVCSPASAPGGAATCGCHAALDESEGGCVWRGLLEDGTLDDVTAWRLYSRSSDADVPENASAEVRDGRLELRVSQRCSYAWGGAVARLPASTQLPEGAALVFDYRALGVTSDDGSGIQVRLNGSGLGALDLSGRSAVMQSCVALDEYPRLALLEFEIQANGTCADEVALELSIDNVRLEAEPSCGPR
jgi:hypothetical protein